MQYKKNQYSEEGRICGIIIGAGFIWWGINVLWPFYLVNLWGLILVGIGLAIIGGNIAAVANRGRLRRTVKYEFESNPGASVDSISQSTGITRKDVQAIVLDLKMRGELRGNFSSKTGELKTIPVESPAPEKAKPAFCPHCGTTIKKGEAKYCAVCGAGLE